MLGQVRRHPLMAIFVVALFLRLAFSFYFQQFYFGHFIFKYSDTPGYLDPILNLINHGTYMGDFYLEDSKYFRVPVYPGFLGIVHLVFGSDYFDYAVAFLQSVIDAGSALLVYRILLLSTGSFRMAMLSGLLYASYPFIILWTPISYTDILQTFIVLVLLYTVLTGSRSKKSALLQGALVGVLVLTKQYLGLLVLVPLFMILFSGKMKERVVEKIILIAMVFLGMGLALSPWVARNYVQSGMVIILKGESTGLRARGLDFETFEKFANLFNENITPMLNEIAYRGTATFNKHPAFVDRHRAEIDAAVKKAHECGTSFMEIRMPTGYGPPHTGCNREVIQEFQALTKAFWEEVPLGEALETRGDAVKKIFLKSDVVSGKIAFSKAQLMKTALFKYRVLLLLLGFAGIILVWMNYIAGAKQVFVLSVGLTAMAFYAFFALMIVHVEMRYILLPDLLVSIFASVPIVLLVERIMKRSRRPDAAGNIG